MLRLIDEGMDQDVCAAVSCKLDRAVRRPAVNHDDAIRDRCHGRHRAGDVPLFVLGKNDDGKGHVHFRIRDESGTGNARGDALSSLWGSATLVRTRASSPRARRAAGGLAGPVRPGNGRRGTLTWDGTANRNGREGLEKAPPREGPKGGIWDQPQLP